MTATTKIETTMLELVHDAGESLLRVELEPYDYVIFRGSRESFAAHFPQVLAEHRPELVARYPHVNPIDDVYGFLGACVVSTVRENAPYYWVGLTDCRHWYLEQAIREHGTESEKLNIQRFKRGFMTNAGRFVNRRQAMNVAQVSGQLLPSAEKRSELYSDDVW